MCRLHDSGININVEFYSRSAVSPCNVRTLYLNGVRQGSSLQKKQRIRSVIVLRAIDALPKHRYDLPWVSSAKNGASGYDAVGPSGCSYIDG